MVCSRRRTSVELTEAQQHPRDKVAHHRARGVDKFLDDITKQVCFATLCVTCHNRPEIATSLGTKFERSHLKKTDRQINTCCGRSAGLCVVIEKQKVTGQRRNDAYSRNVFVSRV